MQELGISATEEDGLLHGLLVRTTLLAAGYARYNVICLCYMMIAFGAATPSELPEPGELILLTYW